MNLKSWSVLAVAGCFLFFVLYLKDKEISAGVERLSHIKAAQQSEPGEPVR